MTKLELTVSASTFECVSLDDATAQVLGVDPGVCLSELLADEEEFRDLQQTVHALQHRQQHESSGSTSTRSSSAESFGTLNLVFAAPNAFTEAPPADRTPVHGVFRSPMRAVHTCSELHLACFVRVEFEAADKDHFHLVAIEYSRKHREKLLRQEFGSWLLEEHIEKAVIATDPVGTVVFWNRFASELYQWTKQEAVGQNILELTPSEMTQEQGTEIFAKLTSGQHWKGFFGVRRKDSSQFIAHVTDTPILDNDSTLRFIVGVSADYTQMHNLMDELQTLNDHLEKEVDSRTQQLLETQLVAERAKAASASKTEMMQMLSHEFRTPLQGIMGVASTMLIDLQDGVMYDCLSTILASSRLLLTLINNVLDLGKMDADMMQAIETCTLPVIPCIRDSIMFCEHFAALNEVRLVLENDDVDWTMKANRLRLEQIMVNLLSNGIKYTEPGTDVVITVRQCSVERMVTEALNAGTSDVQYASPAALMALRKQRQTLTVVSVRDHGRGIPEGELPSLFGEFVQLEISKEKDRKYNGGGGHFVGTSSGSGLGLNLVMKFVSRMDGHIWIKNCEQGGGAIFSFCFPKGEDSFCDEDSSRGDSRQLHWLELSKEDAESFRVLVVDDSMINLKVLERMLARLGVKEIKACSDGRKALEYMKSVRPNDLPNVILSDLNMPHMNGYELIQRVRGTDLFDVPPRAMACSADWTRETEEKCAGLGFDGVLRKPITFSDLRDFLAQSAAVEAGLGDSWRL